MNHTPKVVLSKTLDAAPWGRYEPATVVGDDVERRVRELKENQGKNIVIYGSAKVVQSLTQMGLIDEYHMLVHPVILEEACSPSQAGSTRQSQARPHADLQQRRQRAIL